MDDAKNLRQISRQFECHVICLFLMRGCVNYVIVYQDISFMNVTIAILAKAFLMMVVGIMVGSGVGENLPG